MGHATRLRRDCRQSVRPASKPASPYPLGRVRVAPRGLPGLGRRTALGTALGTAGTPREPSPARPSPRLPPRQRTGKQIPVRQGRQQGAGVLRICRGTGWRCRAARQLRTQRLVSHVLPDPNQSQWSDAGRPNSSVSEECLGSPQIASAGSRDTLTAFDSAAARMGTSAKMETDERRAAALRLGHPEGHPEGHPT